MSLGYFCLLVSVNWSLVHGEKGNVALKAPAPESRKTFTVHFPRLLPLCRGSGSCPVLLCPAPWRPGTPVPCPSAVPWAPATARRATACSPPRFSTPWLQVCCELRQRSTAEFKGAFKPHTSPAHKGHGAALSRYQPSSPPASHCKPRLWHLQAPAKSATSSSRSTMLSGSRELPGSAAAAAALLWTVEHPPAPQ